MRQLLSWMRHLNENLNELIMSQPELAGSTSYIISKISSGTDELVRLRTSISKRMTNLVNLGHITHPNFGQLNPSDMKIRNIAAKGRAALLFELSGKTMFFFSLLLSCLSLFCNYCLCFLSCCCLCLI